ncbi:hypothetical protein [Streptomyces sp. NPDC037389]|uniref:hypothetical protein n=1 Tax=Streptomyces sp. NPDC037389 TaxID=3155369 RepID=UPI0033DABE47
MFKRFGLLTSACVLLILAPAGSAYADPGDLGLSDLTHVVSNELPGAGQVVSDLSPELGALIDGPGGAL